ncbi:MAG: orc1/cdc6 family replication initiation protein [Methanomassiliicoccales archaeon]|nr:MAG: orc1/cdc6 family replication initiation protein [Methanomassiliicoccales archaeon]
MTSSPAGASVFKDIQKLSFDYVPKKLIHREPQMKRLRTLFRPVVESNFSQSALIKGSVGTGKTHLSKIFSSDLSKLGQEKGKYIEHVLVNCRQYYTEDMVLLKIISKFQPHFPDRGFSVPEKLEVLRKQINKSKCHLLIVLDEVDVLLKKSGSNLIYTFTRFDEEVPGIKASLSLILISQHDVFPLMDAASLSTFRRTNVVTMNEYDREELKDILVERVELAFFPGSVPEGSLDLIADMTSESGDARFGIELLMNSGMLTDEEGVEEVSPEHVRLAKAETFRTITEEKLAELDKGKKLTLLAIARKMKKSAYINTGEAEESYAVVCEEFNEKKRGHTQFWKYIKDLDALGFIDAKISGEGVVGKTTLISLSEIPAKQLEEILEKEIARSE